MKKLPNILTAARLVCAPLFAAFFARDTLAGYIVCMVLVAYAIISDWLDGYLARRMRVVSSFGKLFDPIADYTFFLTAFLAFVAHGWMPLWMFLIILAREVSMHLGLRRYLAYEQLSMPARRSGKLKTALQCVVVSAALLVVAVHHRHPLPWFYAVTWWMFLSVALASAFSMIEYGLALQGMLRERRQ